MRLCGAKSGTQVILKTHSATFFVELTSNSVSFVLYHLERVILFKKRLVFICACSSDGRAFDF